MSEQHPHKISHIEILGVSRSSKNARDIFKNPKTGKIFLAKNAPAREYEKTAYWALLQQKQKWIKMLIEKGLYHVGGEIKYPLRVNFFFFRPTRQRADFLNLTQLIADCMVKAGYLADDSMAHFIPNFYGTGWAVDKARPRTVLWL